MYGSDPFAYDPDAALADANKPRRRQTFTYGYGRAEDFAGIIIVIIAFSLLAPYWRPSLNHPRRDDARKLYGR